jgi:hypothetical protein
MSFGGEILVTRKKVHASRLPAKVANRPKPETSLCSCLQGNIVTSFDRPTDWNDKQSFYWLYIPDNQVR